MPSASPEVPGERNLNKFVLSVLDKCNHLSHLKQLQAFLLSLGNGHAPFYAFKLSQYDLQKNGQCCVRTIGLWSSGHASARYMDPWIHIYRNRLGPNLFVSSALVDMCGKCGCLKEARMVFDETSERSLTFEIAIALFEEMIGTGVVSPDGITFVGLLNACTHGGLVEQGCCNYFISMAQDYGIESQIEHYGCVIDLLGRAGRFKEAMDIQPDEVVWSSLLNSCKFHGCMDLAEFAVQRLIEIDPHNAAYGLMLANIYGESGNTEHMRKVRKMLQEKGITKTPGCSRIEIDNQVHQFYSAHKIHTGIQEIYRVLESLLSLEQSSISKTNLHFKISC
ncbi:hypothetical protein NE237_012416 [Protea cynaroides]|uniref:Pentatricopeptide repeat-containing protein n=1 Tax=Protea cynaroides TaxID=273540 RepID=A0A9Q0GXF8_9MAGN|nr:hypothetical protein NE237_012416 [Protea cynaroides]